MLTKAVRLYGVNDIRLDEVELPAIKDDEILLYRVRDISLTRSLGQMIFGVGTITIISSDKSSGKMEILNVKSPKQVKELIHQLVEESKTRRRFRFGEFDTIGDDNEDVAAD